MPYYLAILTSRMLYQLSYRAIPFLTIILYHNL